MSVLLHWQHGGGGHLLERLTGADTFRSQLSNFLSSLGRFSQIFRPLCVPCLSIYPFQSKNFLFVRSRTIKMGVFCPLWGAKNEILCQLWVTFLTAVPLEVKTSASYPSVTLIKESPRTGSCTDRQPIQFFIIDHYTVGHCCDL